MSYRDHAGNSTIRRWLQGADGTGAEGCLSRMLVNRSQVDVDTAWRLAEEFAVQCRQVARST